MRIGIAALWMGRTSSISSSSSPRKRARADADHSGAAAPERISRYDDDDMHLSQLDNHPTTPIITERDAGQTRKRQSKSISDRVHGQIELNGLLVAVMDTPEFQRLDKIKQLGGCAYVYPSATHTRKEHSIGVAHLAGVMVRHLRSAQPDLEISPNDVLCVELAGLVHDLGHGPFSHMFETFMKKIGKEAWEHEQMSGKLFRLLVESIRVEDYFEPSVETCSAHLPLEEQCAEHLEFVIALIHGLKDSAEWPDDIGRPPEKRFLFDIVANSRNGVRRRRPRASPRPRPQPPPHSPPD